LGLLLLEDLENHNRESIEEHPQSTQLAIKALLPGYLEIQRILESIEELHPEPNQLAIKALLLERLEIQPNSIQLEASQESRLSSRQRNGTL
jgi:hypothetical protein